MIWSDLIREAEGLVRPFSYSLDGHTPSRRHEIEAERSAYLRAVLGLARRAAAAPFEREDVPLPPPPRSGRRSARPSCYKGYMYIHDAASAREWATDWIKYAAERRSWGRTMRMLQDTIAAQRTCARSCRSRGQDATAKGHEAAVAELGLHVQHAQAEAEAEAATQAAALRAAEAEREAMWARFAQKRAQGGSPRA